MKIVYGISYPICGGKDPTVTNFPLRNDTLPEFFDNKDDAIKVAKGIGWSGADGTVIPVRVHSSVEEYETHTEQERLKKAENKLTTDELELLRKKYCGK
jgi:hypothetical protein